MEKSYLCTRPTLATILMKKGYSVDTIDNPFSPGMKAWSIALDMESAKEILNYFHGIGKPCPAVVCGYIIGNEREGETK